MAEPFLAEIRLMSFSFPPKGWALCNGQLLPINQNQALFALLGTYYGGDGRTNFGLPNLSGRVPVHRPNSLGMVGGQRSQTLNITQIPAHTHVMQCVPDGNSTEEPDSRFPGRAAGNAYGATNQLVAMAGQMVGTAGGGQAHANMQPYLALSFCIALQGIFPSQY